MASCSRGSDEERRRADVVGVSFAAFDREGVRFGGALGYADLRCAEPIGTRTKFRGASISKLFTTMLVLRELEAGGVSLDEPANRYLEAGLRILNSSGVPDAGVTVRHLLTHTSGLPVSWKGLIYGNRLMRVLNNGWRTPRSTADVVSGMRTVRAPGEVIVYSNGGFALLGLIMARLHKTPYEDLVRWSVLDPLAMHETSFPLDPRGPGIATPYGRSIAGGAGRSPCEKLENHTGPAGALLTTIDDLARFGRMVLRAGELDGARVVSQDWLERAASIAVRNHRDLDAGWGLGFETAEYRGYSTAGHSGGLTGTACRVELLPNLGVGVAVLSNGGDPAFVGRVVCRLLDQMIGPDDERLPGSPRGIDPGTEDAWRELTKRAVGTYRMVDAFPPGP